VSGICVELCKRAMPRHFDAPGLAGPLSPRRPTYHESRVGHFVQNRNQPAQLRFRIDDRNQDRLIVSDQVGAVAISAFSVPLHSFENSRAGNFI
jgi:hypothetical protein